MPHQVDKKTDPGALAGEIAAAIGALGKKEFPDTVLALVNRACPFDAALMVVYGQHHRPLVVADRLFHAARRNTAANYVDAAYHLDPFYIQARSAAAPALLRMRDIAPTDFETSEYFVSYYKQSGVIDELNYLVPIGEDRVAAISFERAASSNEFSPDDIAAAADLVRVVSSLVAKHYDVSTAALADVGRDVEHERIEEMLGNFGNDVLTPRECEVVQRMLKGYSASAAAEILGVSVETIRVHRRNIYEKLNISSLAELFSLALRAIYDSRGTTWS